MMSEKLVKIRLIIMAGMTIPIFSRTVLPNCALVAPSNRQKMTNKDSRPTILNPVMAAVAMPCCVHGAGTKSR